MGECNNSMAFSCPCVTPEEMKWMHLHRTSLCCEQMSSNVFEDRDGESEELDRASIFTTFRYTIWSMKLHFPCLRYAGNIYIEDVWFSLRKYLWIT